MLEIVGKHFIRKLWLKYKSTMKCQNNTFEILKHRILFMWKNILHIVSMWNNKNQNDKKLWNIVNKILNVYVLG